MNLGYGNAQTSLSLLCTAYPIFLPANTMGEKNGFLPGELGVRFGAGLPANYQAERTPFFPSENQFPGELGVLVFRTDFPR